MLALALFVADLDGNTGVLALLFLAVDGGVLDVGVGNDVVVVVVVVVVVIVVVVDVGTAA
jgi:hypothetical protein